MIHTNKAQFKGFVVPELQNKLFINALKAVNEINLRQNIRFYDVKLIKLIINFETISGKRPKIRASLFKKKIILNLLTTVNFDKIILLQAKPIAWSNFIKSSSNVSNSFFSFPLQVKNSKLSFLSESNSATKLEVFIKSAYID